MSPPETPPEGWVDPQRLQQVLIAVHDQVAAALWLSAGMILAVAAIALTAWRLRRTALVCGLGYCITLCFVPNGHAQILGPLGCGAAVAGLAWPRRRSGPGGDGGT